MEIEYIKELICDLFFVEYLWYIFPLCFNDDYNNGLLTLVFRCSSISAPAACSCIAIPSRNVALNPPAYCCVYKASCKRVNHPLKNWSLPLIMLVYRQTIGYGCRNFQILFLWFLFLVRIKNLDFHVLCFISIW